MRMDYSARTYYQVRALASAPSAVHYIAPKKAKVSAVFFDWNYTLARVTQENSISERISILLRQQGLEYPVATIATALNERAERIKTGQLPGKLNPRTRRDFYTFYTQILELIGFEGKPQLVGQALYSGFGKLPMTMYEDSCEILEELASQEITVGVISNISATARQIIERGVQPYMRPEHIIISEEVGVHKPAKTIFALAAARVRARPQNCIYVGDDLENDATGAVEKGNYRAGLWLNRRDNQVAADDLIANVHHITSLCDVTYFV